MSINSVLPQRLRELRKKAGLTQEELAERVEVHLNTISRWELGIDTPKTWKIKLLAEALNVSEMELLNGPANETWELKLVVNKSGSKGGGEVDMTGNKSSATLSLSDDAMGITLSGSYELWENDAEFEAIIEQLRKKRQVALKMRKEW